MSDRKTWLHPMSRPSSPQTYRILAASEVNEPGLNKKKKHCDTETEIPDRDLANQNMVLDQWLRTHLSLENPVGK